METIINSNLIGLVLLTLVAGAIAGILAGLLGVGGGIVVVPLLYYILTFLNYDQSIIMHVAVGTSLFVIVPTSIRSAIQHKKRDSFDARIFKKWFVPMVAGTIIGSIIANYASFKALTGLFASIALIVSLQMFLSSKKSNRNFKIPKFLYLIFPCLIGLISVMMGIGGGTMSVPVMNHLGVGMRKAVGTSASFGTVIAIPGTIGFIVGGMGNPLLPPFSLGYINIMAFSLIVPATLLTVQIGVNYAHRISQLKLRRLFALFLGITAIKMLSDLF